MVKTTFRHWTGKQQGGGALKPSAQRLIDLIDPADPAFPAIADVLKDMVTAGVVVDEPAACIAIKLGRQRRERDLANSRVAIPTVTPLRLWPEQGEKSSIVYYARRSDLIKIGTTTNPNNRFKDLLPDEILAWEPGGLHEETIRHRQFKHLRHAGEYFRVAPVLISHCASIRKEHGNPDPGWRTVATPPMRVGRVPILRELPAPTSTEMATATDAATTLGIKKSTVAGWVFRKLLKPVSVDDRNRPLYFLDHVRYLKSQSVAYRNTA